MIFTGVGVFKTLHSPKPCCQFIFTCMRLWQYAIKLNELSVSKYTLVFIYYTIFVVYLHFARTYQIRNVNNYWNSTFYDFIPIMCCVKFASVLIIVCTIKGIILEFEEIILVTYVLATLRFIASAGERFDNGVLW